MKKKGPECKIRREVDPLTVIRLINNCLLPSLSSSLGLFRKPPLHQSLPSDPTPEPLFQHLHAALSPPSPLRSIALVSPGDVHLWYSFVSFPQTLSRLFRVCFFFSFIARCLLCFDSHFVWIRLFLPIWGQIGMLIIFFRVDASLLSFLEFLLTFVLFE